MAGVTGLLLGSTGVATADVVTNNLAGATTVNVAPGASVAVVFKLTPTSGDGDVDGCNALGEGQTELNVTSIPAAGGNSGLSISPAKKNFKTCKKSASVTFSVGANVVDGRTYDISAVMSGGKMGSKYTNNFFTLRVVQGLRSTTLGLTPSAATTVDYGTPTLPLSATLLTGATPVVGKTVAFEIEGSPVGTAVTNSSGVATLAVPVGTTYDYTGTALETLASFAGDTSFATSSAIGTLLINKAAQAALTITGPLAGTLGQTLAITASGGSGGGATTYGATGTCSLNAAGTSAVLSSTGICTITATKAESTNYNVITATRSFTVGKATQPTLTVTSPTSGTYDELLLIGTNGGMGTGALSFTTSGGACTIEAGQLRITSGSGTCSVTATKEGDSSYELATSAAFPVDLNKAAQTLRIIGPTTGTFEQTYPIDYTAGPGTGAVTFSAGDGTVCQIVEGNRVRITSGTGTCVLTGGQLADGNYAAATVQSLTVTANKASATLTFGTLTATYDGVAHPVSVMTNPAGLGAVAVTYDSAATAPTHAGSYAVVAALDNANYMATAINGTLVVSPKTLTGAITAVGKEYDGNTYADVTPVALTGVVGTDDVFLAASNGQFATAGAGAGKTVTADISLSGAAVRDYALSALTASTTANIAKRTVTGAVVAADKNYDQGTTATTTPATLDRAVTDDLVSLVVDSASFALATAGEHLVTANVSLAGAAKDNYELTSATATDLATIRALALTGSITAANKVYDGSTAATVTPSLIGVLDGDVVTASAVLSVFEDKNVGTGRAVTAGLELGGPDSVNYTLGTLGAGPYSTTANITKLGITGSFTADNKVYDGTMVATVLTRMLTTPITNDDVTLSLTAAFATKDAGLGKAVLAVSPSLTGGGAGNYLLGTVTGTTANITPMPVTGAITAEDKVYDGATTATVTPGNPFSGLESGDVATLVATNGLFADANVGNRVVTAAIALTGAQAGNYQLSSSTAGTTANITAAPLTVTASGHTLTAGAAVPTITPSYAGFVNGEGMDAVTTPPTCSTTYTVGAVGTFPSTCSGAVAANYAPTYTAGVVSVTYAWTGFFQPIDALANHSNGKDSTVVAGTVFNKAKAGSTIPVKFSLNGDRGLAIFATGFPKAQQVSCTSATITDDIEEFSTATTSVLKYDATAGQYIYSWKTPTSFGGTCQRLQVKLADGTSHYAFFTFTK